MKNYTTSTKSILCSARESFEIIWKDGSIKRVYVIDEVTPEIQIELIGTGVHFCQYGDKVHDYYFSIRKSINDSYSNK